ncbi:hypothetical protein NDR87_08635 [Nocardia sp. CDC159]|uniref:Beta-lactamase family protein n=1 Tax=Nocardia pulmonis TaxID=2951408 RepID=A0A9X2E3H3_9NOCA|nr:MULTISPECIES: hypothetical protein [Nocardia]MCM6773534.1 hypothetical protein [Nocardia pulmonis]MCM6786421.1 hypothetical protein [Nocardia sp. CDC159]
MTYRALMAGLLAGGVLLAAGPGSGMSTLPDPALVPPRTALSFRWIIPSVRWGTANEHERRNGLSMVKLYMVDYALRHGDGSAADRELGERMIRRSDDAAASLLAAKYPRAIDAVAAEYHLADTVGGADWGSALTSTADLADFLAIKMRSDRGSLLLTWMADAEPIAADGTEQDWGTAKLPGVLGSKWGWSDFGPPEVASASIGLGFTVAAHTQGTADEQTDDVLAVLQGVLLDLLGVP